MRYRLRTLLIGTAVGPPLLALAWWTGSPIVLFFALWTTLAAVALDGMLPATTTRQ
jgi:hypothetical protein